MRRSYLPPDAIHSAGPPGGYLPAHRFRCEAIADDSGRASVLVKQPSPAALLAPGSAAVDRTYSDE